MTRVPFRTCAGSTSKHSHQLVLCFITASFVVAFVGSIFIDDPNGWLVPQSDGRHVRMRRSQRSLAVDPRSVSVKFYLFTKSNSSGQQVTLNDVASLSAAGFNKGHPTRITIHGWQSNLNAAINVQVRSALLAIGNYNVFAVDWSGDAESRNYASVRFKVSKVGAVVAEFIDFLNAKGGMPFDLLGLVGHSLGAHVAGFAGKAVRRGKVHTIEGLDPASPLFSYSNCAARLCSTDANYVETIQTNGGGLAFLHPIGKASFFPNGGKKQPGCNSSSCAHERAVLYYVEAIRSNDFPTMKCGNYEEAVNRSCGSTYSAVRMGAVSNYGISGYFYVPVHSTSPYGYGS